MKALKIIGIIVALLIVVGIIGFVVQTDYSVERSVTIDASEAQVVSQLNNYEEFVQWNPWSKLDTNMSYTFSGNAGEVGHGYEWSGNEDVGKGRMEIASIEGNTINMNLTFVEPWESVATTYFTTESTDEGTTVTWGMTGKTPMLMSWMGMESMIGQSYEEGLETLKTRLEAMPSEPAFDITTVDFPERYYVVHREMIGWDQIGSFFETHFGGIYGAIGAAGVEPTTMPSGIYWVWDAENQMADMGAAAGVASADVMIEGYETVAVGGGQALMVNYYGPYEGSGAAHEALEMYATENGIQISSPIIEEYANDPAEVEESEILTIIYYPIEQEMMEEAM